MDSKKSQEGAGQNAGIPQEPHSKAAEISTIGAILIDESSLPEISSIIGPDDFYDEWLGSVMAAMLELQNDGIKIDHLTVWERMGARPKDSSKLSRMIELTPTSLNAIHYARIIAEHSNRRRLISIGTSLVERAYKQDGDPDEIQALGIAELSEIQRSGREQMLPVSTLAGKYYDVVEALAKGKKLPGISTGYRDLDRLLAGLHKGDLIYMAARPSMGKTSLALGLALNVARAGGTVAFFSLEMSHEPIMMRLISIDSSVPISNLSKGRLSDEEWRAFIKSIGGIGELNLYIDPSPGITTSYIRSRALSIMNQKGIDLIIVDYLQLMYPDKKKENRRLEVGSISGDLKALAKDLMIPVVACSQLSRGCEQRSNKRPMLSDLRESGELEQDADVVMFIYRDEMYNDDTDTPGVAEIIIGKHRNGPTGTVELFYDRGLTRFSTIDIRATRPPEGDIDDRANWDW